LLLSYLLHSCKIASILCSNNKLSFLFPRMLMIFLIFLLSTLACKNTKRTK
jgi:hypothetical protein